MFLADSASADFIHQGLTFSPQNVNCDCSYFYCGCLKWTFVSFCHRISAEYLWLSIKSPLSVLAHIVCSVSFRQCSLLRSRPPHLPVSDKSNIPPSEDHYISGPAAMAERHGRKSMARGREESNVGESHCGRACWDGSMTHLTPACPLLNQAKPLIPLTHIRHLVMSYSSCSEMSLHCQTQLLVVICWCNTRKECDKIKVDFAVTRDFPPLV